MPSAPDLAPCTGTEHHSPQKFQFGPRNQPGLGPFDFVDDGSQLTVGMWLGCRYRDDPKAGALPEVLMLDLGDRHVELPETIFDAAQDHSLVLERLGARNVELDGQQTDNHTQCSVLVPGAQCWGSVLVLGAPCAGTVHRHRLGPDRHALHREHLDEVANFDVVESFEADAALDAGLDLADIIFEAPQRTDLAFVHEDVVPK